MSDQSRALGRPTRGRPLSLEVVLVAAVLGIVGLLMGGFALAQPPQRTVARPVTYSVTGAFAYTAPVDPHSLYGASRLTTGEPVFLSLVHQLTVSFAFHVASRLPLVVSGSAQLVARLQAGQDLNRTFALQPPTVYRGARGIVRGTISLPQVSAVVQQLVAVTGGIQQQPTLQIVPRITVHGTLGGRPLRTSVAPALGFALNGNVLQPTAPGAAGGLSGLHPYSVTQSGAIARFVEVPTTLSFRGLSLSRREAELISLGLLALAVILLAIGGRRMLGQLNHRDERVRIAARHGDRLVAVLSAPSGRLVEMASFDGLVDLSKRFDCPILQMDEATGCAYLILDDGIVYRYRPGGEPSSAHHPELRRGGAGESVASAGQTALAMPVAAVSVPRGDPHSVRATAAAGRNPSANGRRGGG